MYFIKVLITFGLMAAVLSGEPYRTEWKPIESTNYEPVNQIQQKIEEDNVINRIFTILTPKQLDLTSNSRYLVVAFIVGSVGLAGLSYQFIIDWRAEQERKINQLTERFQTLENQVVDSDSTDSTISQDLKDAVTSNCNKLAEITNLAYTAVSTTTNNNFNFIQRLIAINTNSCPAL